MHPHIRRTQFVACVAVAALPTFAQNNYIPARAPYAETLVVNIKARHKELQKLGLHAIPPGQHEYAIIANIYPDKIGKKSSAGDIEVVTSGKPLCKQNDKEQFYDLKLQAADATGKPFGLNVMEINFKFAKSCGDALSQALKVRDEVQSQIPSADSLFAMAQSLKSVQTQPLTIGKTKFDHFGIDLEHHRLFATAEDQHEVLVLDSSSGKLIGHIQGVAKPHAVLYRADLDRIYVTDGVDGAVKTFDGKTYKQLASIPLAKDADAIGFEPARNLLYVVNGGKDAGQSYSFVSVINTTTGKKDAEIRVDGETLEGMALDIWRPRGYVNNKAKNAVTVLDRWNNKVVASWTVTLGKGNVAMALDEQHQRLFVGCRSGNIVVFDTNTGKELQALSIPPGVDELQFDPTTKRLYAVGAGVVSVYEESDADHYNPLMPFKGLGTAATGTLVPELNRFFVAVPSSDSSSPAIQILEPVNLLPGKPADLPARQPVHSAKALELDFATMAAHPDLRKMGFHAIPPGGRKSVIIANVNTTRIGIPSSDGDLSSTTDGQTSCSKKDDGAYYGVKQALKDASGHRIGILVMEMPYTSAANEQEAVHRAEDIGREVARQIPSSDLFFH